VKDGRPGPTPFTGVPMEGPELVALMTKGDGMGGAVWTHRIKSHHHLAAALRPPAMLGGVGFADVHRGKARGAIRSQIKSEDPFCSIGRRCMTLIET
jgi:hypothetical protein